jgi:predicted nucleic acid-binding protein
LIVVDSSVWIDYFNGRTTPQTQKLTTLMGEAELLIGDIILCGVLRGALAYAVRARLSTCGSTASACWPARRRFSSKRTIGCPLVMVT